MAEPVQVTIDAAGRVVIPKQVRERLGLAAGSALDLDELGDHIELRPAARAVWIDRTAPRPTARAGADATVLTADDVRGLVLPAEGYPALLRRLAAAGLRGGAVYDGPVALSALPTGAVLLTLDARGTYRAVDARFRPVSVSDGV